MQYKEDLWNVEIRPINFVEMNEAEDIPWIDKIKLWLSSHTSGIISPYKQHPVGTLPLDKIKETRLRDKYIKIKVRYSGEDLAIVLALKTIFTHSYA
jgi:hypothetical protein